MKNSKVGYIFLLPVVISCLFVLIYPLIYNLNLSFRNVNFTTFIRGGAPWVGLNNYLKIIRDALFAKVLLNTLIFWLGSISFQFLIGLALALLFYNKFPLNLLYRSLVLLPWFVPLTVSGAIFKWFFAGETGFINSFLIGLRYIRKPIPWLTDPKIAIYTVTLVNIWLGIPFNFIMIFTGLQAIPTELFESAKVDGARDFQILRYITLPLLKPTIMLTLVLGSIFTIKVFDIVWVLTAGGPGGATHLFTTLAYHLAFQRFRFGESSAVVVIMMVILFLLVMLLQRIRRGGEA